MTHPRLRYGLSFGLSFGLGAVYAIGFVRFATPIFAHATVVFVASSAVFVVIGFMIGRHLTSPLWSVAMVILGGIGAGVLANAIVDDAVSHLEKHNLFPFEIALVAAFAMPGFVTGLGLVRLLRQFRTGAN